jgi:hypothetical protein
VSVAAPIGARPGRTAAKDWRASVMKLEPILDAVLDLLLEAAPSGSR